MSSPVWELFFEEHIKDLLTSSQHVIDIGGGLRLDIGKGDRVNKKNDWLIPLVKAIDYKILDVAPVYNADIVGDIHDLPFENNSLDGVICLAVLEHVHNPIRAMEELYRVLRPGGKLLIYVPFLFYYHSHGDGHDYGDYWRFTEDTVRLLGRPFSSMRLQPVKQPVETLVSLSPLVRFGFIVRFARFWDTCFFAKPSKQTSGYYAYLTK